MADRVIGALPPDDLRWMYDTLRQLTSSGSLLGEIKRLQAEVRGLRSALGAGLYVRNDSGEEVPAFGVMQITGTAEEGGQNYVTIDKPDGTTDAHFLFNGPEAIEDGGYGLAQNGPVYRVLTDGGTVATDEGWGAVSGQWYVDADIEGVLVAIGEDDIETDVARFRMVSNSVADTVIVEVPESGLPALSGGTPGSDTCNVYYISSGGTLTQRLGTSVTVYNLNDFAISGGVGIYAIATKIDGKYVMTEPPYAALNVGTSLTLSSTTLDLDRYQIQIPYQASTTAVSVDVTDCDSSGA